MILLVASIFLNLKSIANYRKNGSQFRALITTDFHESESPSASTLQFEKVLNYDTKIFDFNKEVKDILREQWVHDFENFGTSHNLRIDPMFYVDKNGNKINAMQHRWNKERSRDILDSNYKSFDTLYRRFMEQVIGPLLGGTKKLNTGIHSLPLFSSDF